MHFPLLAFVAAYLSFLPLLHAQEEFGFTLSFEDSLGNRDSVIIGYDPEGTTGIDPHLEEVNILTRPLNNILDVRLSNVRWMISVSQPTFQTKKQISPMFSLENCYPFYPVSVEIHAKYWPITVRWNKELFQEKCRTGSVFAGQHPHNWWDVPRFNSDLHFGIRLISSDSLKLNSYHLTMFSRENNYINENGDTIPVFWVAIGDSSMGRSTSIRNNTQNDLLFLPRLVQGKILLPVNAIKAWVFNLSGKILPINKSGTTLDLRSLSTGIYLVRITLSDGGELAGKVVLTSEY